MILRRLKNRHSVPMATATPRSFNPSRSSANVTSDFAAKAERDQFGVGLNPMRVAVAALALGRHIALPLFLGPPADRARRAHPEPFSRRPTRQSPFDSPNDTTTKVNR